MAQPSYLGLQVSFSKVTKNVTGLSSAFPIQLTLSSPSHSRQEGSRMIPKALVGADRHCSTPYTAAE